MLSSKQITFRLFITVILLEFGNLQAQTYTPYVPNVIPPSPNSSALLKFSDVPVSPYTGTADITVPFYNIQARGISLPVSLAYHSGGIKLKEEAGWVGLGWSLNAGGEISRTIMNYDDFGSISYFTTNVDQIQGDIVSHGFNTNLYGGNNSFLFNYDYKVPTSNGSEDLWQAFTTQSSQAYDMEPDIYNYNFPGHSGKFIILRNRTIVLQRQDNITIQFETNGNSFSIRDENGNKYIFVDKEYSMYGPTTSISSWHLSTIVTQLNDSVKFTYASKGNTTVQGEVNQTYGAFCAITAGLHSSNSAVTQYSNTILSAIDFANGQIQFSFDTSRTDLQNGARLNNIKIYSKTSSGTLVYNKQEDLYYSYFNQTYASGNTYEYNRLRLDSVRESSGSYVMPAYQFIYNDIPTNSAPYSAKHSFSVDHWGFFNGTNNTSFIPSMTLAQGIAGDVGAPSGQFLTYSGANRLPSFNYMQSFSLQTIKYPTGGKTVIQYEANDYDRTASINGPQDFRYVNLVNRDSIINISVHGTTNGTLDLSQIVPLLPLGSPSSNLNINVAFVYTTNNQFTYHGQSNLIYFNFTSTGVNIHEDASSSNLNCQAGTPVCSVNIPATITASGICNWSVYIDPTVDFAKFSEVHLSITWQETQDDYSLYANNSLVSPAAGLRVKTITNYTNANNVANRKNYVYGYLQDKLQSGNPQQYSYGRLMSFPVYARYQEGGYNYVDPVTGPSGAFCTSINLFGSSLSPVSSVIQGNIVGYDQVTEYSTDSISGLDNGKIIYKYFNSPDSVTTYNGWRFPGVLNVGNNLNGSLVAKVLYANKLGIYIPVSETDNYFRTVNRKIYFSPKYEYPETLYGCTYCSADAYLAPLPPNPDTTNLVYASFYPSIKSEKILLDSTIDYIYDQNDPSKFVKTTKRNYYDNPATYLLTRNNQIDSKGNSLTTFLKYPQDYIPIGNTYTGNTIIDTMIQRNIVSEAIEKRDSLYYSGSSTGYITGAQLSLYRILSANNNTVVPDKIYKLDIQSPITNFQPFSFTNNVTSMDNRNRQMVSFDQYDPKNDIQQYTSTDQNPVTIIWDYLNKYPIAQVKNASLADVAATSFEADGKGGWTFSGTPVSDATSPTGGSCYSLASGSISKSGLTSTTAYVVSYWSKTGTGFTVSGSTSVKQGKTINGWTYFEHTVNAVTSVTVSGSGSIDELRIYPSTALMTTFTYSPLVGMTTQCDADNKISYYFYDGLNRLKWIKDQDGNIIKTFQYHYQTTQTQY